MITTLSGGNVGMANSTIRSPSSIPSASQQPSHRTQPSASSLRSSLEVVPYTPLTAQEVDDVLVDLAHPYTGVLDIERGIKVDGVSLQPCKAASSQDRYVVEQFSVGEGQGMWTLTGVFDGHLGNSTVEHTAHHLPVIVQEFLTEHFERDPSSLRNSQTIANLLQLAISSFDDAIVRDVAHLFPGNDLSEASLERLSDADIRKIINDYDNGLANYKKVRLCLYGTTALVALVDPKRENLWVANLGDSQAVLAKRRPDNSWTGEFLTRTHNGSNQDEVAHVRAEHPDEPECIKQGRVLGAIAPFRCIGDHPFKLPASFTRRILFNLDPGYTDKSPWEQFLLRNRTPPYISAEAEVVHLKLRPSAPSGTKFQNGKQGPIDQFLILCTDGLGDLYEDVRGPGKEAELAHRYVQAVVEKHDELSSKRTRKQTKDAAFAFELTENYALKLLRSSLGGTDTDAVSQLLTVETEKAWIDDTTVIVQLL